MADETDSYCLQVDVEGRTGRGPYKSSTFPTDASVLVFMEDRAAEITQTLLNSGVVASPPNGADELPATTSAEVALKNMAAMANALLAAGDAEHAKKQRGEVKEGDLAPKRFWDEGQRLLGTLSSMAAGQAAASASPDRSHTKSGGIAKATFNEDPNAGKERDRSSGFSLSNKW